MTAAAPRIAGFVTRTAADLVPPRSASHDLDPLPGGVAAHYGGDPAPVKDHAACIARWRSWQALHMAAPRGWNDIAYTGGYCSHGYALAGRGVGVRTAGQGTDDGNARYYAVCWINDRNAPTAEALGALSWWVAQLRAAGAGLEVWPHRHFHSTSCPGSALAAYVTDNLNGLALPPSGIPPHVDRVRAMTLGTQRVVHVAADGAWGPITGNAVAAVRALRSGHPDKAEIRQAQHACGAATDGIWGPLSKAAHVRTVRGLQQYWGLIVPGLATDGLWGEKTDVAWKTCRARAMKG